MGRSFHIDEVSSFKEKFVNSENFAILSNRFVQFTEDVTNIETNWLNCLEKNSAYFRGICGITQQRRLHLLTALKMEGYEVVHFTMKTEWRFIPGLGTAHIKETGISLEHIYGLPQLGGSACKGLTRQYVLEHLLMPDDGFDLNKMDMLIMDADLRRILENEDQSSLPDDIRKWVNKRGGLKVSDPPVQQILEDDGYRKILRSAMNIFGSQNASGKVIFLDAFPESLSTAACIMNPHYNKYYSGNGWPHDTDRPIPVKFLTVKDAQFYFGLASRDKNLLSRAQAWLTDALEKAGAGAKTAVDYGYFTDFKDHTSKITASVEEIYKEKARALMTPLERRAKDIKELPLSEAKCHIREYFEVNRDEADADERHHIENIIIEKVLGEIKTYSDHEFDGYLIDTILDKLSEEKATDLAKALIGIKRFGSGMRLFEFLPREMHDVERDEILKMLKGTVHEVKQGLLLGRKFMENQAVPREAKKAVAEAFFKLKETKAIKRKELDRAKKTADQYR